MTLENKDSQACGNKKTTSQFAAELAKIGVEDDPTEYQRAMFNDKRVLDELWKAIDYHKEKYDKELKEFYPIIMTKQERTMTNVVRTFFTCRVTCPAPHYDQSVFKYTREGDKLEYLWSIPKEWAVNGFIANWEENARKAPEMARCIYLFKNGKLHELCAQLNEFPIEEQKRRMKLGYGIKNIDKVVSA